MTAPKPPRTVRAARSVRAAIDFLAQDGRADRYLAVHHVDPVNRRCASCGNDWPCAIAVLARKGAEKAASDAHRAATALGVGDHPDTGTSARRAERGAVS